MCVCARLAELNANITPTGASRSHFKHFKKLRKPILDKNELEISRLEKRLEKVSRVLFVVVALSPSRPYSSKSCTKRAAPWEASCSARRKCRWCSGKMMRLRPTATGASTSYYWGEKCTQHKLYIF